MCLNSCSLDRLILEVFEMVPETFYFPISCQKQARQFIKALHDRGVNYNLICKEINEPDTNFNVWRKGVSRQTIGDRIIERINKPIELFLESAAIDISSDKYEDFYYVEPDYFISPVVAKKNCKHNRKNNSGINKNHSITKSKNPIQDQILNENRDNYQDHEQKTELKTSPPVNSSTPMGRDTRNKNNSATIAESYRLIDEDVEPDKDKNDDDGDELTAMDESLSNLASAYVDKAIKEALNNFKDEQPSEHLSLHPSIIKRLSPNLDDTYYDDNKLDSGSYFSCTSTFMDDQTVSHSCDKDFYNDNHYKSSCKYFIKKNSQSISPEKSDYSDNSNSDVYMSPLVMHGQEIDLNNDQQHLGDSEDKAQPEMAEMQEEVIPDHRIIRENECYNSDEDDQESMKFLKNHHAHQNDRNKPGFIYIFMQPITDDDCSRRFKIGASRNPGRKYLQSLNFNVELKFMKAYKVSNMAKVLETIVKEYSCFRVSKYEGWFEADQVSFMECLESTINSIA